MEGDLKLATASAVRWFAETDGNREIHLKMKMRKFGNPTEMRSAIYVGDGYVLIKFVHGFHVFAKNPDIYKII